MDNKLIGNRIESRRKSLGLTMEYVASEIGVAKSTVQRYEKGSIKKIKLPVLEAIARVLDVNPAWLCGKSDSISPVSTSSDDLNEYLEILKTRPECRMLFSLTKDATKEEVEKAVAIIEALRKTEGK